MGNENCCVSRDQKNLKSLDLQDEPDAVAKLYEGDTMMIIKKWDELNKEATSKDLIVELTSNDIQPILMNSLKNRAERIIYLNLRVDKQFTTDELRLLCEYFPKFKKLASLTMNVTGCEMLKEKGLEKLGSTLMMIPHLVDIKLSFGDMSRTDHIIPDDGYIKLVKGFSSLSKLNSISLHFIRDIALTDTALVNLGEILSIHKQLLSLELGYTGCPQISDVGLRSISESFPSLSLVALALNFGHSTLISNEGLKQLKYHLPQLKQLNTLGLAFDHCSNLTDEGVAPLIEVFSINLVQLSLNFNSCSNLTSVAVNKLGDLLKKLRSLNTLELQFHNTKTADDALINLGISLEGMATITSLKLNFSTCPDITDAGITDFADRIGTLTLLETLHLNFDDCKLVIRNAFHKLNKSLEKLGRLNNLNLNFCYCERISDPDKSKLQEARKDIPKTHRVIILATRTPQY
jgi:hypothetical protein